MITTTKAIDLEQLDKELGSHGLNMEDDGTTKTITPNPNSPVTEKQLSDAIAAHVPTPVAVPTIAEKLAKLGIDDVALRKHLGLETPVLKKQLGIV